MERGGELIVRAAQEADIAAIEKLEKVCFASPWSYESLYHDIVENKLALYIVAESDGKLCGYVGVPVEGELGHVGATKDEVLGNYTDVAEAERFVKETGVSALAVMVGTAHGRYKKAPVLDIQRIRDIREATGKLPLVLHGGSGVPDEQIRMAVEAGIRKVNFATDLCYAFLDQVMVTERTTVALDVFMREPIHAIRDYCIGKIRLLGADRIL